MPSPQKSKYVLKTLAPLPLAKIYALSMAFFGLVFGIFFALISAFIGAVGAEAMGSSGLLLGAGLGFGAIIVFPIFYGVMGFLMGLIGAAVYNLFAKWVGGMELELEEKK
jgi:hypothetical protein